jgi:hypothetical protein
MVKDCNLVVVSVAICAVVRRHRAEFAGSEVVELIRGADGADLGG